MREIIRRSQFKRDTKRAKRNPRQDTARLLEVIEQLALTGTLASEYLPHPLSGNWSPAWECHIQPDFLLIYRVTDTELHLIRCGSHSELGL